MTVTHGGLDLAELRSLGLRPQDVLDFSSSINPLGTSDAVSRAAAGADLASYPDRNCTALVEALSATLDIPADHLLVGNGATELIHLVCRATLQPDDRCLVFDPTFGEYAAAAKIAGAEIHRFHADQADAFRWDIDRALATIRSLRPTVVFLCNPNNPTGVYLDADTVERISAAVAANGLLVVDDAYAPLVADAWQPEPLVERYGAAIVRSMTKHHALAGVRLGVLIAPPSLCAAVRALQPPWSVSAVAQAAGLAAVEDEAHVEAAREVVRESKAFLADRLESLGLAVTPSAANFLLVDVGDAARVRSALLERGIAVRDCTSFGLPGHIRIGVRILDQCARLIDVLTEVLSADETR